MHLGYIVAQTLRLVGQGVKVCVEIFVEACDAGLVPEGADIIAVAGNRRGADTVAISSPGSSIRSLS